MINAATKPAKPSPDFPLFPHASGKWCKKIAGKPYYFGRWEDPDGALQEYNERFGTRPAGTQKGGSRHSRPDVPSDFPLYPHATGRWCKRIKGKLHYFGKLDDPEGARQRYDARRDALEAGLNPVIANDGGLTMQQLREEFISVKAEKHQSGELDKQTLDGYQSVAKTLVKFFGPNRCVATLQSGDFNALVRWLNSQPRRSGERWSLTTFANFVRRSKVMFNYASSDDVQLIDRPVPFGQLFSVPKSRDLRVERQKKPKKFFAAGEIHRLLGRATMSMRAMILLGVNCGFGNRDCGELTTDVYDPSSEWLDYARAKTGIKRRCPLWLETRRAMQDAWNHRRQPLPGYEQFVFISRYGRGWYSGPTVISQAFRKLSVDAEVELNGRGFYSLRHVFQTIGEETNEAVAVGHIMGHSDNSMAGQYREFISDSRLTSVTDHVHAWLFNK